MVPQEVVSSVISMIIFLLIYLDMVEVPLQMINFVEISNNIFDHVMVSTFNHHQDLLDIKKMVIWIIEVTILLVSNNSSIVPNIDLRVVFGLDIISMNVLFLIYPNLNVLSNVPHCNYYIFMIHHFWIAYLN